MIRIIHMLEMCIVMDEKSIIGSLNKPLLYNGSDIFHIIKIMIVFSYCLCVYGIGHLGGQSNII